MDNKLKAIHAAALQAFDAACEPTVADRGFNLRDRRFVGIAGAQYEDQFGEQFVNTPRIEIDKTSLGLEKIMRDYQANRVTVDYRPVGDASSEETADMLDGLFRADLYRCKGQQAFDNAFYEGTAGGIGAWRLVDVLEDELDPENEHKRIDIVQIADADQSVWFDANSKLYDKSDALCAWVITAMTRDAFNAEYGADKATDWPDDVIKPFYDWFTPDVVRVAEYYAVEIVPDTLWTCTNPLTGKSVRISGDDGAEEVAELKKDGWKASKPRKVKRRRVHKYILNGCEVLEDCGYIAGSCIPVVPYYGKRMFIDNMERASGYVRKMVDPARVLNAQISQLVEIAAASPFERPIVTPAQIAGHTEAWAEANIKRAPFALLNPVVDANGNEVPSGPIGMVTPPQVPPVVATLVQAMSGFMDEMGGAADSANETKSNVSAQAMEIAAQRTDAASYSFMDNFRQSMQRCGEIYASKACEIYVEDGRVVETLGDDGERGEVELGQDIVDESGRFRVINDLSRGKYMVISDVTEQTATRRDKTARTMLNVAAAAGSAGDTAMAQAAIITAVANMDGEGLTEFKDWNRGRALSMGLAKPTDEEKQKAAQASEQKQPGPEEVLAQAVAAEKQASAMLKQAQAATEQARAGEVQSKTMLNVAQAEAAAKGDITPNADPIDQVAKVAGIAETEARTALLRADAHKKHFDAASTVAALGPAHPTMRDKAPKPGDVEEGHVYLGGDPGNAASWQPVQ